MGWGDDLIYLGEVKHRYLQDGKKRRPLIKSGKMRRTSLDIWYGSPYLDFDNGEILSEHLPNGRRYYTDPTYVLKPAEITLVKEEIELAEKEYKKGPFWIICPDNKPKQQFANNRHWGNNYDNWQKLVNMIKTHMPNQRIIRLKPEYSNYMFDNAENIASYNVRFPLTVASKASLIITTEGFWHHLAAAWNRPCVVLYAGCTSPYVSKEYCGLGYEGQCNIIDTDDPKTPCYTTDWTCEHCLKAWSKITPNLVYDKIVEYIKEN